MQKAIPLPCALNALSGLTYSLRTEKILMPLMMSRNLFLRTSKAPNTTAFELYKGVH